jgi:hypothetical protein
MKRSINENPKVLIWKTPPDFDYEKFKHEWEEATNNEPMKISGGKK